MEIEKVKESLEKEYFLLKRGTWWAFLGGMFAFLMAVGVVSYQSALKAASDKAAQDAVERIKELKSEAEFSYQEISELRAELSAESVQNIIGQKFGALENKMEVNQSRISALGENDCKWMPSLSRHPLENIQYCPDGFYAKGLGFNHSSGADYAYQMSYRLYCCSLN